MFDLEINSIVSPELEVEGDLGNQIESGGLIARIADKPIAHRLKDLFAAAEIDSPENLALYERFSLWLVPHRFGLIKMAGLAEPVSVGIDVEYDNDDRTCSIVSLLPSFEFIDQGGFGLTIDLMGNAKPSAFFKDGNALSTFGLDVRRNVSGEISLDLSARVLTPIISAIGVGSSACAWRFDKHDVPLLGHDISTWALIALPRDQHSLSYRMKIWFCRRTLFFQTRVESLWVDQVVELQAL